MHILCLRRAGALLATISLLLAVLSAPPAAAVEAADTRVFINEMHYDNTGVDAGEFIEVAGPAGTNLAGWSLVLYNGNGGAAYDTDLLSGTIADQQGGYGTVTLSYPANGIQNGSPDGVALVNAGDVVQFLSYEGVFTAVGGPANGSTSTNIGVAENGSETTGQALRLTGTGSAYGDFTWAAPAAATPGAPNPGQTFGGSGDPDPEPDPCQTPVTHTIPRIQGAGFASDLAGTIVTIEGVVVGDFQDGDQLRGIFLQDAAGDGDATTSDGIFVDDPDGPPVVVGDVVRATGTAREAFGLTQLSTVTTAADCGDATPPPPTLFVLPADSLARERVEGMLVSLVDAVTATETFNLGRFGELVVSSAGRLYVPTNGDGTTAAENDLRRLIIDDASTVQNPADIPFASPGDVIRLGATLVDVVGVMSYGFGEYRLQPTRPATVLDTNPRPVAPDAVGGDVQVASFNVLNYFTTVDNGDPFPRDLPRGADTAAELASSGPRSSGPSPPSTPTSSASWRSRTTRTTQP